MTSVFTATSIYIFLYYLWTKMKIASVIKIIMYNNLFYLVLFYYILLLLFIISTFTAKFIYVLK